ncbi:hypothetical protein P3T76_002998 [Phytophthora citrophthora]|uniref:Uncharacterized protein n=1 Tax=Phytophthora citrophthora TaxID=4793 RepID=A0AAD9LQH5_9STRA|nr:hypothetical protein P3T76_002998 [Phytophthora citrophthora]
MKRFFSKPPPFFSSYSFNQRFSSVSKSSYLSESKMDAVLFLLLLLVVAGVEAASIRALNGFGNAVAWWSVLKLPSHVQSPNGTVIPTPCACPVPDCSNVPTTDWPALNARATGLCYLYADSNSPKFRHFRDLGYECLGQGGNDPLSQTLKQKHNSSYWALFNDQLNGIAGAYKPKGGEIKDGKQVCGGGDLFSAHAKGAVAFQDDSTGGFFLQTSTPNFPDPTLNDSFVRLGCQADNNVQFAQHMLALSVGDQEIRELGEKLQLARLCSANFFRNGSLHELLRSEKLFEDGAKQENTSASAMFHALLDPSLPAQQPSDPVKAQFSLKLIDGRQELKSRVFEPLREDQNLTDLVDDSLSGEETVLVLVKSPRAAVPPWALVAEMLDTDVSVASWWDGSYGIPTICAGDVYTDSPNQFCLNDPLSGVELNFDGSAPYNIENLMEATWHMSDGSFNLTWQLVGGRVSSGNHGKIIESKWGLATPRFESVNSSNAYVTFGDLNMEGFPCSKACNGSQAGRGGSFFSLMKPSLHTSLAESIISGACRCSPPPSQIRGDMFSTELNGPGLPTFEKVRMCHRGCIKKIEEHLQPEQLPVLNPNATSFWSK